MVYRSSSAKIFEKKCDAKQVCHELRQLCPSNANLINIEPRRAIFDMQYWLLWVLTLPAARWDIPSFRGADRARRHSISRGPRQVAGAEW